MKAILKFVGFIFFVAILVAMCSTDHDEKKSTSSGRSTSSSVSAPAGPQAPPGVTFSVEPGASGQVVSATFKVQDNFTAGMRRSVAQSDTVDILHYAYVTYPDASRYWVNGTFPMTDEYGNTRNRTVLEVGYDRSTLAKINWDGMNQERIWDIRDAGMVHPDLQ